MRSVLTLRLRFAVLAQALLLIAAGATAQPVPATDGSAFGTGARLDMQAYAQAPQSPPLTRGDYTAPPPRMMLEAYVPTPGDQGAQGSCVGWAVAYAARTLLHARDIAARNQSQIDIQAFSPAFVYNQIHYNNDCIDGGSLINDALDLLRDQGVPRLADFPYDPRTCARPIRPRDLTMAAENRISGWRAVTRAGARSGHVPVRRSIAAGRPVIIGMMVPPSFMDVQAAGGGLWQPSGAERAAMERGEIREGHAMTVVGYDDTRHGGAFRVVNSWGTRWGDRGFFWITYGDFALFVRQAYEMIPSDPPPPPAPVEPNLGAVARFIHLDGQTMNARRIEVADSPLTWRLTDPQPSGSRFRVELTGQHNGHVYVLGSDESGRFVELYPRAQTRSPILTAGDTMLLPGPTEDHYTRLDDTVGTDFYIILMARQPLDIDAVRVGLSSAGGDLSARLRRVLGPRLILRPGLLRLEQGGIGFSGNVEVQQVVPLVVEIEHVAPPATQVDLAAPRIAILSPEADLFHEIATGREDRQIPSRRFTIRGIAQDISPIAELEVEGAISRRFSSLGPFEAEVELAPGAREGAFRIFATDSAGNTGSVVLTVTLDGN